MATDAEKGLALLKSIISAHGGEWSICRHCLAVEEVGTHAGMREVAAVLSEHERLRAELDAYRTAGLTVREDCAQEALAEAQVCGCGQRIAERIRTVQGRGFGTADICQRCRGLQPCGCGHEADLHQRRLEAERENTALRERLSTLDPSAGGFVCGD